MAKNFGQGKQAVTANRLGDGAPVYRTRFGQWSAEVKDAAVADNADVAEALLAETADDVTRALIVAPYLIDVECDAGGTRPANFRERIRAFGPTAPLISAPHGSTQA
jgi:sulfite reductase (NADPH) hemoprotein beta-component